MTTTTEPGHRVPDFPAGMDVAVVGRFDLRDGGEPYGTHALIRLSGCDLASMRDPDHIRQWLIATVDGIEMVAYGNPFVADFGHAAAHTRGHTAIQPIETSSIVAHYADLHKVIHLDVFSCKDFDPVTAARMAGAYFAAKRARIILVDR